MKKIIALLVLLTGATAVFAQAEKKWDILLNGGLSIPATSLSSTGINADFQGRFINKDHLALMADLSLGYAAVETLSTMDTLNGSGFDSIFLFGVGGCPVYNETNKLIVGGVLGVMFFTANFDQNVQNYGNLLHVKGDYSIFTFMMGADVYYTRTISEKLGFYAGANLGFTFGGKEKVSATGTNLATNISSKISDKISAESYVFFLPKIGVRYTL